MELREFFNTYYKDDMLYRAYIWYGQLFESLDELITFKINQLNTNDLKEIVQHMSMQEIKQIARLHKDVHVLHLVEPDNLPVLKENLFVVETPGGDVTHHGVVNAVYDALLDNALVSDVKMMLDDDEIKAPRDIYKLKPIYNGQIYWLYDNFTSGQLRRMIHELNITDYGSYKTEFINTVVYYLTNKTYLAHALSLLSKETTLFLKRNAENDVYIYENKTQVYKAKQLGILVPVHRDYLVMHKDVLETLKEINVSNIKSIESSSYYNGYELLFTVNELPEITRRVAIPTRLNFYELMEIIKQSFIWENKNNEIRIGNYVLTEDGEFPAKFFQVDALLLKYLNFQFLYHSSENYTVHVELIDTKTRNYFSPKVIDYSGEAPIDNVGTLEDVKEMLSILSSKNHQKYDEVFQQARTRNYRERYPLSAINTHLERTIKSDRIYKEEE